MIVLQSLMGLDPTEYLLPLSLHHRFHLQPGSPWQRKALDFSKWPSFFPIGVGATWVLCRWPQSLALSSFFWPDFCALLLPPKWQIKIFWTKLRTSSNRIITHFGNFRGSFDPLFASFSLIEAWLLKSFLPFHSYYFHPSADMREPIPEH